MAYTDSFLTRAITEVRELLDEPTNNAKFTDDRIIVHLEKSYILILNEINRVSKTQIVARSTVTVSANTTDYILPYVIGSIYAIYDEGTDGNKIFYDGRSRRNPFGRGIAIEGHTLKIQTVDSLGLGKTLTIEWVPMGIARLHNGTCTINSAGTVVTFGATPNAGALDTHINGYAGSLFRMIETTGTVVTGNFMQEHTIASYDASNREATLDVPLTTVPTTDDGGIFYEIAPAVHKGMDMIVPLYAAYRIAASDGNRKRSDGILKVYRQEIRNVRLTSHYTSMTDASRVPVDNHDVRRYRRI